MIIRLFSFCLWTFIFTLSFHLFLQATKKMNTILWILALYTICISVYMDLMDEGMTFFLHKVCGFLLFSSFFGFLINVYGKRHLLRAPTPLLGSPILNADGQPFLDNEKKPILSRLIGEDHQPTTLLVDEEGKPILDAYGQIVHVLKVPSSIQRPEDRLLKEMKELVKSLETLKTKPSPVKKETAYALSPETPKATESPSLPEKKQPSSQTVNYNYEGFGSFPVNSAPPETASGEKTDASLDRYGFSSVPSSQSNVPEGSVNLSFGS